MSGNSVDCTICQRLKLQFLNPEAGGSINLGSFKEALSSQCSGHIPLIQAFWKYCDEARGEGAKSSRHQSSDDVGFKFGNGKNKSITLVETISKGGFYWDLLLVHRDTVNSHTGVGRVLDPDWVDLSVVNKWKEKCLSTHGTKCSNPMKVWPTKPAYLVDVEKKCVVSGKDCNSFVSLSYTWGGKGSDRAIRVDSAELLKLQKPGALEAPEILSRFPPVLWQAMYMTSVLGERYLWVDALCIVHAENSGTADQLLLMSAIYASASVTIIAADGDCQTGLLGIPGWTYQEHKMSQRRLFFSHKELHWKCQCSVWHEELILNSELDEYIDPRLEVILAGFPDTEALGHILSLYNDRQLTYEEDALPGIIGLLTLLSRAFPGGFLYGLPEVAFESFLCWQPCWGFTNIERRVDSGRPSSEKLSPAGLPSWSWLGWKGLMKMCNREATRINPRVYAIQETHPITEWFTASSPKDSSPRRIRSTWFENRNANKDLTRPLPPGWKRCDISSLESFRGEPHLFPDGCETYAFTHSNMPEKENRYWYYPFPVPDITEHTRPMMPDQTEYLFCKTDRANLWARKDVHEQSDMEANIVDICDETGNKIGRLHLHNKTQLDFIASNRVDGAPGTRVELVAVCKTRQYRQTWNEELRRYDNPLQILDNYQVLWIEWKDGVAYRLASGHVESKDWLEAKLENISLVLG
ncbi:hypothetical protein BX600DRAFT_483938 [Xylariales sp. PMI_506]|nr:hypothetical protein BX600DRAFT_483938 [Xylariales sp. PMI_506]